MLLSYPVDIKDKLINAGISTVGALQHIAATNPKLEHISSKIIEKGQRDLQATDNIKRGVQTLARKDTSIFEAFETAREKENIKQSLVELAKPPFIDEPCVEEVSTKIKNSPGGRVVGKTLSDIKNTGKLIQLTLDQKDIDLENPLNLSGNINQTFMETLERDLKINETLNNLFNKTFFYRDMDEFLNSNKVKNQTEKQGKNIAEVFSKEIWNFDRNLDIRNVFDEFYERFPSEVNEYKNEIRDAAFTKSASNFDQDRALALYDHLFDKGLVDF